METFKIPITWSLTDLREVKASSLEEACRLVYENDLLIYGEYVQGSLKIDINTLPMYNDELSLNDLINLSRKFQN